MLSSKIISVFVNLWKSASNFHLLHKLGKVFLYLLYLLPIPVSARWVASLSFGSYKIDDRVSPSAMPIFFMRSESTNQRICVKLWRRYDTFCNIADKDVYLEHLLDGLRFNRVFAPGVYLGIARGLFDACKGDVFQRGWLIKEPLKETLHLDNVEYALVMRKLDKRWRLDHQLTVDKEGNEQGMEFLGREVARMHREVARMQEGRENDLAEAGRSEQILDKLTFNRNLFEQVLKALAKTGCDTEKYAAISPLMARVGEACRDLFDQRYKEGHIKRCHGDLKITNLWIPEKYLVFPCKRLHRRLFALDCVDFNLEFCHIDTLSDVAMLAVDIEVHLAQQVNADYAETLTSRFLKVYLKKARENDSQVRLILEYYLTEKAMVHAVVCLHYGDFPALEKYYLDVAFKHAQRLEKMLEQVKGQALSRHKSLTSPYALAIATVAETIQDESENTALRNGSR